MTKQEAGLDLARLIAPYLHLPQFHPVPITVPGLLQATHI